MKIRASALSAAQRKAVWTHIQATDPDLAELLTCHPLQQIREEFGATPLFPRELVDAALQAAGMPVL